VSTATTSAALPGGDWRRPPPGPAALRRDLVVGGLLVLLALLTWEIARSSGLLEGAIRSDAEQVAWSVAAALPLMVRRRFPVAVMLVSAVVFLGAGVRDPVLAVQFSIQVFFFVALFTAAAWGPDRRVVQGAMGVVVLGMFVWVAFLVSSASVLDAIPELSEGRRGLITPYVAFVLYQVAINVAYFGGAWIGGQMAWRSARQREQLHLQAIELEQQQASEARRAVLDERLRIARELHDVAAHHVSVIGVQAAAARRVLGVDGQAAGRALSAVEESSRAAVGEMRQLLGVLRSDAGLGDAADGDGGRDGDTAAERAPQPGVESLDGLVADSAAAGLQVVLDRVGRERPLPSTVSLSLYRTAQEALANVRRHSTARSAKMTLRYSDDGPSAWVELEVLDDGRPRPSAQTGSGLGHLGMRERAALHGGQVEIGPRPLGGYRVRVRYPLAGVDAAPTGVSDVVTA
jgi:signal transduction histidine kinase